VGYGILAPGLSKGPKNTQSIGRDLFVDFANHLLQQIEDGLQGPRGGIEPLEWIPGLVRLPFIQFDTLLV
jgi:hypothetical protein